MAFKFNPFTGTLDIVSPPDTGDIVGPGSSTDKAIVRWNGTSGLIIDNSLPTIQDGGAIQSNGFVTNRSVTTLVHVAAEYSWIAPELEIELTGAIEIEADGEIIIV